MSNKHLILGNLKLENNSGFKTQLTNVDATSDCIFTFPALPAGEYVIGVGGGSILTEVDNISEFTPGHGVNILDTLHVDNIGELTSGHDVQFLDPIRVDTIVGKTVANNVEIGDISVISNTIGSTGLNTDLNLSATGTGIISGNSSISTAKNIILPTTSAISGQIVQNGITQFHTAGLSNNVFIGTGSGNFTNSSTGNVGIGLNVLRDVTNGNFNVGIGNGALTTVTSGTFNCGIGQNCMAGLTLTGSENLGFGASSLAKLTTGGRNSGHGNGTLRNLTTGIGNIGIGYLAGSTYNGAESFNTCIGYNNSGLLGESFTTRLGFGGATSVYLYGVNGAPLGSNATIVGVSSGSRLGTSVTTLDTSASLNTSANYQVSGIPVLDANNVYISNGSVTATLNNSAGIDSCTFTFPPKSADTYVLATTADFNGQVSVGCIEQSVVTTIFTGFSYYPILLPTMTTHLDLINFKEAGNSLYIYQGTTPCNFTIMAGLSAIVDSGTWIYMGISINGASPPTTRMVKHVIGGEYVDISVFLTTRLVESDSVEVVLSAKNDGINIQLIDFNYSIIAARS